MVGPYGEPEIPPPCRGGACPRPAGKSGRCSIPGQMRTARGCSKRGAPLLGVSIRVGLGRGRNRNLPLPSVVSLWFFLFGQAKRKNIVSLRIRRRDPRNQNHTARATARAKRSGGRPYGLNGTFLNRFRTPNSELRIGLWAAGRSKTEGASIGLRPLPPAGEARAAGEPVAGPLWRGAAFLWLPFWKGELSLQRLRG